MPATSNPKATEVKPDSLFQPTSQAQAPSAGGSWFRGQGAGQVSMPQEQAATPSAGGSWFRGQRAGKETQEGAAIPSAGEPSCTTYPLPIRTWSAGEREAETSTGAATHSQL